MENLERTAQEQPLEEGRKKIDPWWLEKYQWKKGQSGNPKGRPKGSISPTDKIRQLFKQEPEALEDFLRMYLTDPKNSKHIVEMLDGRPKQQLDHPSKGDKIVFIPNEIADKNGINTGTEGDSEG